MPIIHRSLFNLNVVQQQANFVFVLQEFGFAIGELRAEQRYLGLEGFLLLVDQLVFLFDVLQGLELK